MGRRQRAGRRDTQTKPKKRAPPTVERRDTVRERNNKSAPAMRKGAGGAS